ncbi:regulatory protein RecX [Yinghuangia sp. YIM S09857]|uniref:regulatory protein RecX n=1 Tax=Yinghuangia sp. YIM S09857 TaxID=3436929 RepID=UPI003F535C75
MALQGGSGAADAIQEWTEANRRAPGRTVPGAAPKRTGADPQDTPDAPDISNTSDTSDTEDNAPRPGGRRRGRRRRDNTGEPGAPRRERRIGPAQINPDEDPEAQARAICLRQLTGQPRTRAQLADAMKRRGVPDDVAEHVLGRFTEVKLIDDAAFAAAWVDTRHTGRGLARRALAQELRQRGVDSALVSEAVERLDPEQELATARALVERRIPATRRLDRQVRMRRLAGMLARKGYGEGLSLRVVREALDADEAAHRDFPDDPWSYEPFGADDTPPEPED